MNNINKMQMVKKRLQFPFQLMIMDATACDFSLNVLVHVYGLIYRSQRYA